MSYYWDMKQQKWFVVLKQFFPKKQRCFIRAKYLPSKAPANDSTL